jgi:hypothetical protein
MRLYLICPPEGVVAEEMCDTKFVQYEVYFVHKPVEHEIKFA